MNVQFLSLTVVLKGTIVEHRVLEYCRIKLCFSISFFLVKKETKRQVKTIAARSFNF